MQDIKDFTDRELKGLVTLTRITEDALAFSTKKFDPTTGEELAMVVGGSIQEYKDKAIELQSQIDEINDFVAKCEALTAQN
jgi:hypothetical protein